MNLLGESVHICHKTRFCVVMYVLGMQHSSSKCKSYYLSRLMHVFDYHFSHINYQPVIYSYSKIGLHNEV